MLTIDSDIVFIIGLHRSGTTLLCNLLSSHTEFCRLTNTNAPMDEGQFVQSVIRRTDGSVADSVGAQAFHCADRFTERSAEATAINRDRICKEWSQYMSKGCRLVEKSPGHITKIRILHYFFPKARFIVLSRHPVAQAMAIQKWSHRGPCVFLLNWFICHEIAQRDLRRTCDPIFIRYEDLCSDPKGQLNFVFESLGVKHENVLHEPINNTNPKYFEAWKQKNWGIYGIFIKIVTKILANSINKKWGYDILS